MPSKSKTARRTGAGADVDAGVSVGEGALICARGFCTALGAEGRELLIVEVVDTKLTLPIRNYAQISCNSRCICARNDAEQEECQIRRAFAQQTTCFCVENGTLSV